MLAYNLGILPPDFWRMTFWELGAIIAAKIDASAETIQSLDSLFEDEETT